ncbi:hypothetical protein PVAP13_7KG208055 [Panicum virgatum]|uniref:Uncharacterized protein n=1 Tax=Panicum virgatum TaxID=38727 RepID=A0A8T0QDB6_PANVG|nr:hypothetical protein PVAP13_7KG208055 [Panicum virgatum]
MSRHWPHDETAHQCPAAFGASPHCGTVMLCRPRRLCRLVVRVVTTPLLATALDLFLHQYPITPLSATASSWSIKGRIRVAPPSLPTHFQPTRPPSQTWLTHPLGSTRARFCSLLSLRPPFRGKSCELVVLLSPRIREQRREEAWSPVLRDRKFVPQAEAGSTYREHED